MPPKRPAGTPEISQGQRPWKPIPIISCVPDGTPELESKKNGARLWATPQPQQFRKPKGPIQGAGPFRPNSACGGARRERGIGRRGGIALEKGERDRPGRTAARPAQQLFPGIWLALAPSDVQRSAAPKAFGAAAARKHRTLQPTARGTRSGRAQHLLLGETVAAHSAGIRAVQTPQPEFRRI